MTLRKFVEEACSLIVDRTVSEAVAAHRLAAAGKDGASMPPPEERRAGASGAVPASRRNTEPYGFTVRERSFVEEWVVRIPLPDGSAWTEEGDFDDGSIGPIKQEAARRGITLSQAMNRVWRDAFSAADCGDGVASARGRLKLPLEDDRTPRDGFTLTDVGDGFHYTNFIPVSDDGYYDTQGDIDAEFDCELRRFSKEVKMPADLCFAKLQADYWACVVERIEGGKSTAAACGDAGASPAAAVGLSADEAEALGMLAEWEGQSVQEFVRQAVVSSMQASIDDLQPQAAGKGFDEKARRWALKFWPRLKQLVAGIGGMVLPESAGAR